MLLIEAREKYFGQLIFKEAVLALSYMHSAIPLLGLRFVMINMYGSLTLRARWDAGIIKGKKFGAGVSAPSQISIPSIAKANRFFIKT